MTVRDTVALESIQFLHNRAICPVIPQNILLSSILSVTVLYEQIFDTTKMLSKERKTHHTTEDLLFMLCHLAMHP